ncbi:unnamed protein product [Leptidea sinapis]|uniref:Uncharacterized protein n=1 Tax=Leptidea sinapis TaxID=189913 RepID=A0A5E4QDS0_9NEOP|nr:unnamed protein product [Leptidea sinapis]
MRLGRRAHTTHLCNTQNPTTHKCLPACYHILCKYNRQGAVDVIALIRDDLLALCQRLLFLILRFFLPLHASLLFWHSRPDSYLRRGTQC